MSEELQSFSAGSGMFAIEWMSTASASAAPCRLTGVDSSTLSIHTMCLFSIWPGAVTKTGKQPKLFKKLHRVEGHTLSLCCGEVSCFMASGKHCSLYRELLHATGPYSSDQRTSAHPPGQVRSSQHPISESSCKMRAAQDVCWRKD